MADVFSSTVPCADCAERRQDLEATGHRVLECSDDASLPGYCTIRFTRPAAMTDGEPVALAASQAQAARSIINIFETGAVRGDYSAVTLLPGDTGRLTYGRAQTTLGSGNLHLLISRYCAVTGARFGARLRPWLSALAARSAAADTDQKLHNLLRASADDPVMRDVQDAFFDEVYWEPAARAATRLGIRSPLGTAVVYDSWVHGSWAPLRDRTSAAGTVAGIGEHEWVQRYVRNRREWLGAHSNALLRNTVYRMDAFQRLIDQEAWGLPLPLVVRGHARSRSPRWRPCRRTAMTGRNRAPARSACSPRCSAGWTCGWCNWPCPTYGNASARFIRAFQRTSELPETGTADASLVHRLLALGD